MMTNQFPNQRTAGTANVGVKLPAYLLIFSCALLLISWGLGLYSFYTLLELFIKAIPTPLNQFRWLQ